MTPEQRALRACADYARLSGEIKRLSAALADALAACPGVNGHLQLPDGPFDQDRINQHCTDQTHLKAAYTPEVVEGHYDRDQVFMTDAEVREYLALCPHCLTAHEAIQARKTARKLLGASKRAITMIGRRANQQPTTAQDSHA